MTEGTPNQKLDPLKARTGLAEVLVWLVVVGVGSGVIAYQNGYTMLLPPSEWPAAITYSTNVALYSPPSVEYIESDVDGVVRQSMVTTQSASRESAPRSTGDLAANYATVAAAQIRQGFGGPNCSFLADTILKLGTNTSIPGSVRRNQIDKVIDAASRQGCI